MDKNSSNNEDKKDEALPGNNVESEILISDSTSEDQKLDVLLSLEEMIKSNIDIIDKLTVELKKYKEMFEDTFNTNPVYREHIEKVKEATKAKNTTRQQILNQPSIMKLANQIKSIKSELKERQLALSDYLHEYQRMTGATEIVGNDGKSREIITYVKLVMRGTSAR